MCFVREINFTEKKLHYFTKKIMFFFFVKWGEGGVKIKKKWMTSFMDSPKLVFMLQDMHRTNSLLKRNDFFIFEF